MLMQTVQQEVLVRVRIVFFFNILLGLAVIGACMANKGTLKGKKVNLNKNSNIFFIQLFLIGFE